MDNLRLKTLSDTDFYTQLAANDTVQAGDQIEWTGGGFVSVEPGSNYVGHRVGDLNLWVSNGLFPSTRARLYRKVESAVLA